MKYFAFSLLALCLLQPSARAEGEFDRMDCATLIREYNSSQTKLNQLFKDLSGYQELKNTDRRKYSRVLDSYLPKLTFHTNRVLALGQILKWDQKCGDVSRQLTKHVDYLKKKNDEKAARCKDAFARGDDSYYVKNSCRR